MTAAASSADLSTSALIVAEARRWIGTPYHHRAALRGIGCDCLGLVRGVWREIFATEIRDLPAYSADWGEISGEEVLRNGLGLYLAEVHPQQAKPGDVLVFRIRSGRIAKHCGIMTGADRFVHAWEATPVVETHASAWWQTRVAAAFQARSQAGGQG